MRSRFLFPYWCKFLGIALVLVHVPVMHLSKELGFDFSVPVGSEGLFNGRHLFFMLTTLLMLTGLVLIAFSKEKIEDEQINQLRQDSLQWAIYVNYIILIISFAFTDKSDFKDILVLNLWVPLAFFIILFRWKMYRNNRFIKEDGYEK